VSIDIDRVHHLATWANLTETAREMLLIAGSMGRGAGVPFSRLLAAVYDKPQRKRPTEEKRERETRARAALAELLLMKLMDPAIPAGALWVKLPEGEEVYWVTRMGFDTLRIAPESGPDSGKRGS